MRPFPLPGFRYLLLFLFLLLAPATLRATGYDTVALYFPLNVSALPAAQQQKLDSLQYDQLMDISQYALIIGYADYVGSSGYNDTLSEKRARTVEAYLLSMGYRRDKVQLCIGRGEIAREGLSNPKGMASDRRVDIIFNDKPIPLPKKPKSTTPPTIVLGPSVPPGKQTYKLPTKYLDDILTVPISEAVLLRNIYFPPNSHFITPNSVKELDNLLSVMRAHPSLRIRIEGHICCVTQFPDAWDEDEKDYNLSENRAHFIYSFLREGGVDASRMSYAGYGRKRPVVLDDLAEIDAQKNRRVELRVLAR